MRLAGEVAFHRLGGPLVEHFLDMRARAARLQAERVADEVGLVGAVVLRDQELRAHLAQRVGGVERARVVFGIQVGHGFRAGSHR